MNRRSFLQLVKRRLTLRTRLALWVTGLLLLISVGLLVLVNVATPIKTTNPSVTVSTPNQTNTINFATLPNPFLVIDSHTSKISSTILFATPLDTSTMGADGAPLTITYVGADGVSREGTPIAQHLQPYTITFEVPPSVIEQMSGVSTSNVKKDVFHEMRVVSFIGLGVVALLGGLVAYWMAGRALRPVRSLAQAAQRIDAETLDTRLNLKGPGDELKQLADSFDSMMNRLESSFQQQGRFVADAAHELRTPLTTLRSSLDVVSADPNATVENYREMSLPSERALTRLQRVVDDLLLLATEERPIPETPIVLEPLLEETMLDLKPLADEHSVTLKYESSTSNDGLMTRGNSELLMRVFHNLIENGIRYNKTNGEVAVKISEEDGWAVVTVKDTGIGIPPEQLPHIFDRFYRVDGSRDRNNGGAGLGLSIVDYVLHLHNGKIEVESTVGIGTTFVVKLPLSSVN